MKGSRFDELAKTLGQRGTRRGVLKGFVGSAIALVANRHTTREAGAFCSLIFIEQLPCGSDAICEDNEFCSRATDGAGAVCCPVGTHFCHSFCDCVPNSRPCTTSVCTAPGTRYCGNGCVNVTQDRNNCGWCGNVCRIGENCSNGRCCPKGTISCNGRCVAPIECS